MPAAPLVIRWVFTQKKAPGQPQPGAFCIIMSGPVIGGRGSGGPGGSRTPCTGILGTSPPTFAAHFYIPPAFLGPSLMRRDLLRGGLEAFTDWIQDRKSDDLTIMRHCVTRVNIKFSFF